MTQFSLKRREDLAKRIMDIEQEELLDLLEHFFCVITPKEESPDIPSAEIENGVLLISKDLDDEINDAIREQEMCESVSIDAFKKEFAPWLEA